MPDKQLTLSEIARDALQDAVGRLGVPAETGFVFRKLVMRWHRTKPIVNVDVELSNGKKGSFLFHYKPASEHLNA